ncbi:exodeoxyribonuclease V subunit beta [Rheinheimera salexigens]|uniref:RecBCD enzyme subunit RecB n=1 Tax=Rheinheimera salexigens TaxID=1628148 RepID=A0A1E7Q3G4_9GAMM|nr:exodeoxyribonuclease V subunit beta [Rheinheimera salexigens]OEY68697.1 exodeoxyribonuclease V subunit beta [Rheinheimera salexigens]
MNNSVTALNPLTFALHGTRLIEASAGTGKTYTLAALYLRLVLGHGRLQAEQELGHDQEPTAFGRSLLPPEILVVTFTKAATAELRDRIRSRLVEASLAFKQHQSSDSFINALLAEYPSELHFRCAGVLERAAQWMDEAAVFTIHGWCQRMLSEHAFDSGAAFGESLTNDNQQLLHTLACDYWRCFLYPLQDANLLHALGNISKSPESLLADIRPWLQADADNLHFAVSGNDLPKALSPTEAAEPLAAWADAMDAQCLLLQQSIDNEALAQLDDAFANSWLNGNKFRSKSWQEQERPWWQLIIAEPSQLNWRQTDFAAYIKKFSQENLTASTKKKQPQPQHGIFSLFDQAVMLLAERPEISINVRHHAALWLSAEFSLRKKQRAERDFNDLLVDLHQALYAPGGEVLAERIRQQYPIAMVDEFQDTDPIQFAIFRAIYPEVESRDTALILVGDPKQAIYSFRGADLHTYLQARRLTEQRHYNLSTNYRSTVPLVEAVNALFSRAEQTREGAFGFGASSSEQTDQSTATPLPFLPVKAQGKAEHFSLAQHKVDAVNYWLADTPTAELKKGAYQQLMAEACADQIALILQQAQQGKAGFTDVTDVVTEAAQLTPVQPSDIAILVRDRNEAALVRQQLSKRQIRSVYLSDNQSIFASAEATALLYWLRACHDIEDENALRAALALPLSCQSDAKLQHYFNNEPAWEALTEQVREFKLLWRYKGVLALVQAWLHYFSLPSLWLSQEQGERTLTNVLHLAELLQHESQQREGETGLIRWLAEQIEQPDSAEEQQLRLESEQQLVQVVTIHKSKGLQYPLVFLPFICGFKSANAKKPQRYYDGTRMVLDLTPDEAAIEKAEHERLLEDIRLLYVALTRPVYACWLGLAAYSEGRGSSSKIAASAIGYLLQLTADVDQHTLAAALADLPWQQQAILDTQPALAPPAVTEIHPALRLSSAVNRQRWWIASYSALRKANSINTSNTELQSLALTNDLAADTALDSLRQEEAYEPMVTSEQQLSIHDFPRGAVAGTFLHQLFEQAQQHGFAHCNAEVIADILQQNLPRHNWQSWQPVLQPWFEEMLQVPITALALSLSQLQQQRAELEFWVETKQVDVLKLDRIISQAILPQLPRPALLADTLNGMLKGFIDLTLQDSQGRYWVLDYKSNWLGLNDAAYSEEAMQQMFLQHRYDVQAALYLLALHRLLKQRQPGYLAAPEQYIGGALYWFMRAPADGQLDIMATQHLLTQLDALFSNDAQLANEAMLTNEVPNAN